MENNHYQSHGEVFQKIKALEKRTEKIEDKIEELPTMKVLMEQVIDTNKKQTQAINDINLTLVKVNNNMDNLSKNQEKMVCEIDAVKKQIDTNEEKSKIDLRIIFKNKIVQLIMGSGLIYGAFELIKSILK